MQLHTLTVADVVSTLEQGMNMTLEMRQRMDDYLYHLSIGRAAWVVREGHYIPMSSAQKMFCQFVLPVYLYYSIPEINRVMQLYGMEASDALCED